MNLKLHDNGWTVLVEGDITELTENEIHDVAKALSKNMVVVFEDCYPFSPEEQLAVAEMIGKVQKRDANAKTSRADAILIIDGVVRVTGKKNDKGEVGLFGHTSALDWHANQASNRNRKPIVWMYGAEGMEGSRTSFINMIEAYKHLPDNMKKAIANLKCYFGYEKGRYSTSPYFNEHVNRNELFDLVMNTSAGETGLYYPFNQVFGMDGLSEGEFQEIHQELVDHITKEQFAYHHDWKTGQIVLSDQWLSLHKRWEFDRMEERVLHRIAVDYSNVFQSYP
jgi:taurine dioxygenase